MELALADLLGDTEKALAVLDQYTAEFYMVPAAGSLGQHRRRTVQYGLTLDDGSRRLVFYSDAEPPIVTAIIEDPFCPKASTPNIECAIVVTDVCVTLETGDDREQIRTVLVTGLRDAVKSGAFFAAVPPEHIPTVL